VRLIARFAAGCPHDEQSDPVDHSNALKTRFLVSLSNIFSRQEVTIEKRLQIGKIDPVQLEIDAPLGFVPCDHVLERICVCISAQGAAQGRCSEVHPNRQRLRA